MYAVEALLPIIAQPGLEKAQAGSSTTSIYCAKNKAFVYSMPSFVFIRICYPVVLRHLLATPHDLAVWFTNKPGIHCTPIIKWFLGTLHKCPWNFLGAKPCQPPSTECWAVLHECWSLAESFAGSFSCYHCPNLCVLDRLECWLVGTGRTDVWDAGWSLAVWRRVREWPWRAEHWGLSLPRWMWFVNLLLIAVILWSACN